MLKYHKQESYDTEFNLKWVKEQRKGSWYSNWL